MRAFEFWQSHGPGPKSGGFYGALDRTGAPTTPTDQGLSNKPVICEWYWSVLPDGSIGPHGDHKSEEWKASYDTLRALVLTEGWLSR